VSRSTLTIVDSYALIRGGTNYGDGQLGKEADLAGRTELGKMIYSGWAVQVLIVGHIVCVALSRV
jgi:hypothetical protein